MANDQTDFGFQKIIPPDHALVKPSPRRSPANAREPTAAIIDVEVVTEPVTNRAEQVADAVVAVERVTAKVPNAIEVPPTAQQARPPRPQHVDSEKLTLMHASCDVHMKFDERGECRSVRIKKRMLTWSRKRTWLAWIGVGVVAVAAASGSTWLPWVKAAIGPPAVVKPPMLTSKPYGPPKPALKPKRPRQPQQQQMKTPPNWLERQLGLDK